MKKFGDFLKELFQNTIQINQHFLVKIDVDKIDYKVHVHWKHEHEKSLKIDIKNYKNSEQIDHEKNDFGIPLNKEEDLKKFMKDIWCVEIHI